MQTDSFPVTVWRKYPGLTFCKLSEAEVAGSVLSALDVTSSSFSYEENSKCVSVRSVCTLGTCEGNKNFNHQAFKMERQGESWGKNSKMLLFAFVVLLDGNI